MTILSAVERKQLRVLADLTSKFLEDTPRGIGISRRSRVSPLVFESNSGGAMAILGRIRSVGRLEIWLDRYTGWEHPQFWYGIGTRDFKSAKQAALLGEAVLGQSVIRTVFDDDLERTAEEYFRLRTRLPRKAFGRPLVYDHGRYDSGYGLYLDYPLPLPRADLERLARSISRFYEAIALEHAGLDYPTFERRGFVEFTLNERAKTTRIGSWKRSARQMRARKHKDRFTCKICSIDFAALYGGLGRGYAEVHHIISLGSKRKSTTKLTDLITVCANCHAMLTRAPEGPDGLALVRTAFTGKWPRSRKA